MFLSILPHYSASHTLVMLHKLKNEKLQGVFAIGLIDVNRRPIHRNQKTLDATLEMEGLIEAVLRQ